MGEFPIFLTAVAVVAVLVLAPRVRAALRGGGKAMMERLIRHENERKPELGRIGAALMALSRLRADRR